MKIFLLVSFIFVSTCLLGQNNHLSLGIKGNGICFGNSANYNGIRFNAQDRNTNNINGLHLSCYSNSNHLNGICVALLVAEDSISNGIKIGGWTARAKRHNGLAVGGLGLTGTKLNGVGLTGLIVFADTLNGLFIAPFGVIPRISPDTIRVINGFAAGGGIIACKINGVAVAYLLNKFDKQNGVSVAGINLTKELHGFQFGLINCALNNKKFFRWIPIMNFNLRRKAAR